MELEQFKCEVCPHKMKWIMASKKLPQQGQLCIVTVATPDGKRFVETWRIYKESPLNRIIAWMPFPEPYEFEK